MRKTITLIILCLSIFFGFSQTKEIDSISIQLAFQNQDSTKVETSLLLIKSLYEIKEYDRALKYIVQSEKLSSSINYNKGIAEITYYKALIYAAKDDYINATSGYNKAKELFIQLSDTLGVAYVNNSIGLIEIKRGNYANGLKHLLSAIKELESRRLKRELSLAYSHLAKAFYEIHDYDQAIDYNLKALEVQEQLNDAVGISQTNNQLAELYSIKKEYRKAIEFYEKVIEGNTGASDSIRAQIFPKLGGEYLKFNDYEKASKYLIEGYNLNTRFKNEPNLLIALNNLGDLNLKQSRLILAERQLLQAGAIAEKIDNKTELLKHYKLMKALDSTKRNFDRAFIWQRKYYDLKNSLNRKTVSLDTKTKVSNALELETNFDNKEAFIQPEEKATNAEGLKFFNKYKLIFYGLIAALAIVSVFLVLIFLKRNNNIKYTQELEEKNIKIELQNEAFSEQTKHLENVNNVKDKLFSIVSHDLKDSLSSINGFIDLLREGSLTREEFDNLIPELSENANNASLLLFNLLNWSKSQMQSLEPKPTLFDIQEVFEDKVKLVEQRMESKGIELIDHSLRDFAYADRSMFEIVVQNLLANALKFCKNGDSITIANHISNGSCIVSIADTGVGISKENIEKLFKNNSFTTMGTNNEKGTGLGLSICKELIELNNGKIWVESTQGVGSTFYVQLPKSRPNGDH
ncbi:ATP-binding protein [Thalassobellus suaedae]|uniref:histidine kinase n=1 Tax=Thalassobellus suaedae TaxID=3074124 RepID=A0ABY9XQ45_9FLAO|nr:tetratricopeptide repeat-containing sensor histidine kinase [Flavobacteriaceae bacterium HL-DH14]WNH13364.1 tetratricopeptide repeat-containing sensor histidine kinase [Flavobacteriaceae bacterium HL-DH10]